MQDAQESMKAMEALTRALEQQTRELELLKQQLAEQMVSTLVTVMCCSVQLSPLPKNSAAGCCLNCPCIVLG